MKFFLLLFLSALFSLPSLAFDFTIKGKVTGAEKGTVSVYSAANPFTVSTEIDSKGGFILKGDFPRATQLMINWKGESGESGYEIYLFDDAVIDVTIDVGGQYPDWQLKGVPALSEDGYEKIPSLRSKYIGQMRATKNDDSLFAAYEMELLQILGGDDLAKVTAKAAKLQLMNLLVSPEMKRVYDIYTLPEFKELPLNDIAYTGIPAYNSLMEGYNLNLITDSLKAASNDSDYIITYKDIIEAVELRKSALPTPIYLDMKYSSFHRFRDGKGNKEEENEFLKELNNFFAAHPNFKAEGYLKQKYDQVKYSVVGSSAPVFTLTDTTGNEHKFPNTEGKYLLVDVWGSWCAPCRFYNKKLVEMYPRLKETNKIEFVSIAYDPDKNAWKKAILDDKLVWPQLYSTPEFIKDYHITSYPTMYLISPEGVVLRKGHLTEEDLLGFIE